MFRSHVMLSILIALGGVTHAAQAQEEAGTEEKVTITFQSMKGEGKSKALVMSTARGAPTFPVLIAGKRVCGLLDTGSSRTVIDLGLARELGLTISDLSREARALGAPIAARKVSAVPVEVPDQFVMQSSMFGIEMPEVTCADGSPIAFVLGAEFIAFMAIAVDNAASTIIFAPSGKITPLADHYVRIDWNNNSVAAVVNGKPARLDVDTGSASDLLIERRDFDTFFADAQLDELPSSISATGTNEANVGIASVSYSVGGMEVTGRAKRIDGDDAATIGNLGYPFFQRGVAIFDAGRGVIWVERREDEK